MNPLRKEMLEVYGGRCACCGESNVRFLTLEHLKNDGAEHRRKVPNVLADLKRRGWPKDDYTILCMNCNWASRGGNECPHVIAFAEKQILEVIEDDKDLNAYAEACHKLGINELVKRSRQECDEIVLCAKWASDSAVNKLKERTICDSAYCLKRSLWFAYLDDLVFCDEHRQKWVKRYAGYEL